MKKIILALCCVLLNGQAGALEVAGVTVPDSEHVGNRDLVLNGAGLRSRFFFKVYVAGLYLSERKTTVSGIMADEKPQRIALFILRELSDEKLLHAFNKAIDDNQTKKELALLNAPLKEMSDIFHKVKEVREGDVIRLDYLPDAGTQVSVNGSVIGTIAGEMFHRAILKIWLGDDPVQNDLKSELLGGR